jgi:hypothetical protein
MYWVSSYFLKENKAPDLQRWLLSDEGKKMMADVENETGMHYMGSFWPILGFGEYDVEDWWELPNWATLDKIRNADSMVRLYQRFFELDVLDLTRTGSNRMMRSTEDVLIFEPEK